ncbi:MAG: helix-turn-helix domain-containing protein [Ignavibacteriota bacterium]
MSVIAEFGEPMRFSRIMNQVEGISQKSLTKTLRGLERDGLITREVFAEVPPRVEYTITALGSEMLDNVAPPLALGGKERPALPGPSSCVRPWLVRRGRERPSFCRSTLTCSLHSTD